MTKIEDTEGTFETTPKEEQTSKKQEETKTPEKTEEEKTSKGDKPETKSTDKQPTAEEFKAVDGARKHFEDLAKEKEKKIKELEKQALPKKEEDSDDRDKRIDFLLTHRDVSQEEFDHIAVVSQRTGKSLEDAAESEKEFIQFTRDKVAKEKKIPESSSPGGTSKSFADEEVGKMTPKEHEKYEKEFNEKKSSGI